MVKRRQKRRVARAAKQPRKAAKKTGVRKVKGSKVGKLKPMVDTIQLDAWTKTQAEAVAKPIVEQLQGSTQAITKLLAEVIGVLSLIADNTAGAADAATGKPKSKVKGASKKPQPVEKADDVAEANEEASESTEDDEITGDGEEEDLSEDEVDA